MKKKEKRKHWSLQSGRGRRLHTDVRPGALKLIPYGRAFSLHVLDSVDSGTEKCFFPSFFISVTVSVVQHRDVALSALLVGWGVRRGGPAVCYFIFYMLWANKEHTQETATGVKSTNTYCVYKYLHLYLKKISWCFLHFFKCWFTVEVVELIPHVEPCKFFLDQCVGQLYFFKVWPRNRRGGNNPSIEN